MKLEQPPTQTRQDGGQLSSENDVAYPRIEVPANAPTEPLGGPTSGPGLAERAGKRLGLQRLFGDSLRRNSLWLMVSMVANQGLGAAFWLVAARAFPASSVGIATGITSLMTITSLASNVGAPTALVQLLPKQKSVEEWSRTFSAGVAAACVTSTLAAGIVLAIIGLISHQLAVIQNDLGLALLFVLGTSLTTLSGVLDYVFIAERASRLITVRAIAFGAVKLVFLLVPAVTAVLTRNVTLIIAAWVLAWLICCALGVRMVRTQIHEQATLRLRGALKEIRLMARNLAGNHFITLGNALPTYVLPVVVITRLSASANAYFYVTWMVGGVFFMISSTVGSSLFADGMRNPEILRARVASSARFTIALAAPAMLIAAVFGHPILGIFGSAYARHGYMLLLILTVSAIPDAITNLYVPVLRVRDRLHACALLTMGMALFAIVASWLVAPFLGVAGIGAAWGVSQALGSVWVAWDVFGSPRGRRLNAKAATDA